MIKRIIIGSVTTLLILLLSLIILLSTPIGLDIAVALAQHFNKHLHIDGARGNLLGQVNVDQIRYINKHEHVIIENVELNWRPLYLVAWQLRIRQLHIKAIHYYTL